MHLQKVGRRFSTFSGAIGDYIYLESRSGGHIFLEPGPDFLELNNLEPGPDFLELNYLEPGPPTWTTEQPGLERTAEEPAGTGEDAPKSEDHEEPGPEEGAPGLPAATRPPPGTCVPGWAGASRAVRQ